MALLLLLGCGDDRPPPPRGIEQPVAAAPVATMEAQPARRGRDRRAARPAGMDVPTATPATPMTEEGPERDFEAELRRIAGDPRSCGELGPATAPITIRLGATVTSQGVVTRGSASGNVPAEIEACLLSRIEHGRFRAPVEDAPRRVSAQLRLEVAEAPTTTTVDTTPMFEPVGVPGMAIDGPSGRTIQGPSGMAIAGPSGNAIEGPSGTPIQGPSGTPIGAGR